MVFMRNRVTQGSGAPLRDVQVVHAERQVRELRPHGLRLRGELQALQDGHGAVQVAVLDGGAEADEALVQDVRRRVDALVHDDLRLAVAALDLVHVALDLVDGHLVRRRDVVPHAQVVAVLRHNDVGARHPLHVVAVAEQRRARLLGDVEKVQAAALVAEQHQIGAAVELQPVDLGVVVDGGDGDATHQVQHGDGEHVQQVRDLLVLGGRLAAERGPEVIVGARRRALVDAHGDEVRVHVLCAARTQRLVAAVLDERQLAGGEHHAHGGVVEEELLGAGAGPRHLAQLAGLQVAHQQRLRRVRHEVAVLEDVDLLDLAVEVGLQHDARPGRQALHDDLAQGDVGELELAAVARAADAGIVQVHNAAQRAHGEAAAVGLPRQRGNGVQ